MYKPPIYFLLAVGLFLYNIAAVSCQMNRSVSERLSVCRTDLDRIDTEDGGSRWVRQQHAAFSRAYPVEIAVAHCALGNGLNSSDFNFAVDHPYTADQQDWMNQAIKLRPNFGYCQRLVFWGCGTSCQTGVLLNLKNKTAVPLPTAVWGYHHQAGSPLLIVNPPDENGFRQRPDWAAVQLYIPRPNHSMATNLDQLWREIFIQPCD